MTSLSCLTQFEAGAFGSDPGNVIVPTYEVQFPIEAMTVGTASMVFAGAGAGVMATASIGSASFAFAATGAGEATGDVTGAGSGTITFSGGGVSETEDGDYPESIVSAGLEDVWDHRTDSRPRFATNKTLGVDSLTGLNASYSAGYLTITGSGTWDRWNFDVAGLKSIDIIGDSSVVVFNDCTFGASSAAAINTYGIQIGVNVDTPTVTFNFCKLDGKKAAENIIWSSAIYANGPLVGTGPVVTINDSWITGCPGDVFKFTNCNPILRRNFIEAFGWEVGADADGIQQISGTVDMQECLWDITDGDLEHLMAEYPPDGIFPGQPPNSGWFLTVDTNSNRNSKAICKNNIFVGWGGYGTSQGTPYNVLLLDARTDCVGFTASCSGTTLTVTAMPQGKLYPGMEITSGPASGRTITAQLTSTESGGFEQHRGTYSLSGGSLTMSSQTMNALASFHMEDSEFEGNVIEKANQSWYVYGQNTPVADTIASWSGNIDFDDSSTIPAPTDP